MKTSSTAAPVKRSTAINCLLVNQFATPGLGSLMGRRFVPGIIQLVMAVAGFVLIIGWFMQMGMNTYQMVANGRESVNSSSWLGKAGGILFLASWIHSWFTSLSLLREAKQNPPPPPATPPAKRVPPLLK